MGENTLRALASDLAYLESWAMAATDDALPWPASESLALKFVAHHLWDPAKREVDPLHGMPAGVAARLHTGVLRSAGPHAPSTVKRRGRPSKHSANGWSGPPVQAFREWLERADISKGPIFRAIDRWEAVEEKALTPQSINLPDRQAAAHISKIVPAVRMLGVGIEWLGDSRKLTASSSNKGQEAVQYGGEGI